MPTIEQIINALDRRVRRLEQGPRDFGAFPSADWPPNAEPLRDWLVRNGLAKPSAGRVPPPVTPMEEPRATAPLPTEYYLWDGATIRPLVDTDRPVNCKRPAGRYMRLSKAALDEVSAAVARMVRTPEPVDPYAEARAAYADGELQVQEPNGSWFDWHRYSNAAPKYDDHPARYRRRPK